MGVYLNSQKPYINYEKTVWSTYFVDKSDLLNELIPIVEPPHVLAEKAAPYLGKSNEYICITRPRRFGKTVMANMIASFFGKGRNSLSLFEKLSIGKNDRFAAHINKHNVIYISFNEMPKNCKSYRAYIDRIQKRLFKDLSKAFPEVQMSEEDALWDVFNNIFEEEDANFIFVFDEWDYIFHQDFATDLDKKAFIQFLSMLLKDQPYVELAYITGILPIEKYSSGSELNMFCEYTMVTEVKYSNYFGFTESEVDRLFHKYLDITEKPLITRAGLKAWYDGYHTCYGERIYNPRSVVLALTNNNLGNYWTSAGPYDEIFYYLKKNIADTRDDLLLMISGMPVASKVREYAATSMNLTTKEEIFSAMVVYGFLSYENGCVSIPNKELMNKFEDMLYKEESLGYICRLARVSKQMFQATINGDTETMESILEYAHDTEIPNRLYNNEAELNALVKLLYIDAHDAYDIRREDDAGKGYVDMIFYPKNKLKGDCLIIELKVNDSAENAIVQIINKSYMNRFLPRLGEMPEYKGRILAVGIAYSKVSKKHSCKIEILRNNI